MRLFFLILFSVGLVSAPVSAQESFKKISPSDLSELLQSKAGQKQVLLIYASWCPHCQIIYPELGDVEKTNPGSVQAISMDKDMDRFARFIDKFPDSPISQLVWDTEYHMGMSLDKLGIDFSGYIPFVALINEEGKPVKQGHVTIDEVKAFLN